MLVKTGLINLGAVKTAPTCLEYGRPLKSCDIILSIQVLTCLLMSSIKYSSEQIRAQQHADWWVRFCCAQVITPVSWFPRQPLHFQFSSPVLSSPRMPSVPSCSCFDPPSTFLFFILKLLNSFKISVICCNKEKTFCINH